MKNYFNMFWFFGWLLLLLLLWYGHVESSCEQSHKRSGSIKGGEFD